MADTASATTTCFFCAEEILAEAKKCRFCGEFVEANASSRRSDLIQRIIAIGSLLLLAAPFALFLSLQSLDESPIPTAQLENPDQPNVLVQQVQGTTR